MSGLETEWHCHSYLHSTFQLTTEDCVEKSEYDTSCKFDSDACDLRCSLGQDYFSFVSRVGPICWKTIFYLLVELDTIPSSVFHQEGRCPAPALDFGWFSSSTALPV